jgi:DNA invertase Pin-like site-specific DNA recombinase
MPAYAYLRKSYVRDPSRTVSYEVQEAAVRGLASRHGDDDGLILLSDWDKSGRLGADKRPGYRALLDAIESGRATAVYSYSLSRLSRSVTELSRLVADCDARGIPVRLDKDSIDTSTASGRLTANVLGSVAQFEAEVASERVRGANAAKLARGESLSTVPFYGDAEADDLDAVLAAYREAGSYSGAARLLNERGVKPRTSKRGWWPSAVASVIDHRIPSERVPGAGRGARSGGSDFLLARLLRCPTCGTRLTGTRDRDGSRVRYSCRLGSVTPHPRVSVSEHLILPSIRKEVARLAPDIDAVMAEVDDAHERQRLESEREAVLDLYQHNDIKRPELERRLLGIDDRMAKLDSRRVVEALPTIDWTEATRPLNAALRAMFHGIELDPETFQPVPDGFDWVVPEWRN